MSKSGLSFIVIVLICIGALVAAYIGCSMLLFEDIDRKGNTQAVVIEEIIDQTPVTASADPYGEKTAGAAGASSESQSSRPNGSNNEHNSIQTQAAAQGDKKGAVADKTIIAQPNAAASQNEGNNANSGSEEAELLKVLRSELSAAVEDVKEVLDYKKDKGE